MLLLVIFEYPTSFESFSDFLNILSSFPSPSRTKLTAPLDTSGSSSRAQSVSNLARMLEGRHFHNFLRDNWLIEFLTWRKRDTEKNTSREIEREHSYMAQTFVTLEIPEESETTSCFCNGFISWLELVKVALGSERPWSLSWIIPKASFESLEGILKN